MTDKNIFTPEEVSIAKALKVIDLLAPEQSKTIFDAYMNLKVNQETERIRKDLLEARIIKLEESQMRLVDHFKFTPY